MAPTVLRGIDGVVAAVGRHLGYSDWLEVSQDRVNLFADATGDHQWIHTDPERASAGPFGGAIAHGYLTLSLSNYFLPQIVDVQDVSMGVNYGLNKVRFPAPARVGAKLRGGAELVAAESIPDGVQTTMVITIEVDGSDKPACVIEALSRYMA